MLLRRTIIPPDLRLLLTVRILWYAHRISRIPIILWRFGPVVEFIYHFPERLSLFRLIL